MYETKILLVKLRGQLPMSLKTNPIVQSASPIAPSMIDTKSIPRPSQLVASSMNHDSIVNRKHAQLYPNQHINEKSIHNRIPCESLVPHVFYNCNNKFYRHLSM
jgi:hypothetical protein